MKGKPLFYFIFLCLLVGCKSTGIAVEGKYWEPVENEKVGHQCPEKTYPVSYAIFKVNYTALKATLYTKNTSVSENDTVLIPIPTPDGEEIIFAAVKSGIMAPELAQKYPELATFSGANIQNPEEQIRFELTPAGFSAFIIKPDGSYFIQPYCPGDTNYVISYYKKALLPGVKLPFEIIKKP